MPTKTFCGAPLPSLCPPDTAAELPAGTHIYRLVSANPPTASDFLPSKDDPVRKTKPNNCDDCRWASYSVFKTSTPRYKLQELTKYPKTRHLKFLAVVEVGPDAGVIAPWPGDPEHLSMWMYQEFRAHECAKSVEPV